MAPVFVGKLLLRDATGVVSGHHLRRLLNTEFRVRHVVSRELGVPALGFHVIHVVLVGTKEQMVNSVAAGVIAVVEHHHSIGDWPVHHFPDNPMHGENSPADRHCPIPHVSTDRTRPYEAFTVPDTVRVQMIRKRCSRQALTCSRLKRSMTREASLMHRTQAGFASESGSLCAVGCGAIHGNYCTASEGP